MNKEIVIKRYGIDDILINDGKLFNTNNHYIEEGIDAPLDYYEIINKGNTKNWIDKFHKDRYKIITLDNSDLKWMKEALQIGMNTGKYSHLYDDEFEMTCNKYRGMIPDGKWFIRSERVSLKSGEYGIGPYDNIEKIIKSMVSTRLGHSCFKMEDIECVIYLMEWKDINMDKEFRVFVYNNKITAISNQNLYSVNEWLDTKSDKEIEEIVIRILDYFENNIKEKMEYMENYTMDFAFIEPDDTPYFIEANSYGKYYAAGSSLYNWKIDELKLKSDETIEIRYTSNKLIE